MLRNDVSRDGPACVPSSYRQRRAGYQDIALLHHDRSEARAALAKSSLPFDFAREVLVGGSRVFLEPLEFDEVFGRNMCQASKHFMLKAIGVGRRGWQRPACSLYAALHHVPPGEDKKTEHGFRKLSRESLTPWAHLTNTMSARPIRLRLTQYLVNPNRAYIKKVAARLRSAEVEMSDEAAHVYLRRKAEDEMQQHRAKRSRFD